LILRPVDRAGNVYIAENNNASVRRVTPADIISTFAGSTNPNAGSGDWGVADGPDDAETLAARLESRNA
jgi:hypothetical protein